MNAPQALHPTDEILHSYGLGQLDAVAAVSVDAHLEGCPDCRRRVAEVTSDSFLGRLRDAKARPASTGPAVSSTDGLSMLDGGGAAIAPPPADTLPPGLADHPDYKIIRELGRGGMGVVYLARNTLMGRREVLKVVGGHLLSRPAILERFQREIRSAARLQHANIVAAYSALRLGECFVLAMEYVEGIDLSRVVKAKGPLPVANACNYVHQAALGLQHAHEHGMVHRDIKPANLILARAAGREGKAIVKVLDFGLAKVTSEGQADSGLTREGQMLGTPDYIAPEQIRDAQSADIRADIYGLGCTLYYLLSGRPPFSGANLWDVYQAHFSMDAGPLNLVRPEVPAELAALVAKMMAKDPARRFQEPQEVALALKPFFKSGGVNASASKAEVSQLDQSRKERPTSGGRSVPKSPETSKGPLSLPPTEKATATTPGDEPMWQGLIETGSVGSSTEAVTASRRSRRPLWVRPSLAAGVLLTGFLIAWAFGVFRVKTRDGVIVLEDVPDQATVFVNGARISVSWPGSGRPMEIGVSPGERMVEVKKDGFRTFGSKVIVNTGKSQPITVRLDPQTGPEPQPAGSEGADKPPARKDDQPRNRFVSLFNGDDLTGWEDLLPNGSEWKVVDHVLEGHGGGPGNQAVLVTQREDFSNFRLRVKFRYRADGAGNVEVRRSRVGGNHSGYFAHQGLWPTADRWQVPVGSITKLSNHTYGNGFEWDQKAEPVPVPLDAWNTLEITVVKNRMTTSVNGTKVAEYTDPAGWYASGGIALHVRSDSVAQFQEIMIEELAE